jgi:CBS domain-containing membrane protein
LAVGGSILAMHALRCLHPPGGATALMIVVGGKPLEGFGYHFLLAPLGVNLAILLGLALLLNNLGLAGRRYPTVHRDTRPDRFEDPLNWVLNRAGLKSQDIEYALRQIGGYIDVSPDDLHEIHARASLHAFERRMGKITCGNIMKSDVTAVEYGTHLEEVWELMRSHRVKGLPVIDRARRVIGIVTIVDFVKRAEVQPGHVFDRLVRFVRRTPGLRSEKPEVAGQIMTPSPVTAREDEHILTLVPLFSEHDIHHIPIVGADGRLKGMVTQSDLMAALYNYRAGEMRRPINAPHSKGSGAPTRRAG